MNIIESILTKNPCYKAGSKITVKGLMLHSVGCSQPNARVFVHLWNSESYSSACVHGFIDANTGDVYQTLPWDHRGWHGGGTSNNTHIGVEMCEPDCIKYTGGSSFTCSDITRAKAMVERTYDSAVELFAMLCKQYNLNPLTDICSHAEGYKKGIASNHGDPEHLWNGLGMGYTMDTFRNAVNASMTGENTESVNIPVKEENASETILTLPKTPFTVKVIIEDLNIRSAPSMSGTVKGRTGKGVFTIVETSGEWGKLKSGAGWIYLMNSDYCTVNGMTTSVKKKTVEEIAKEVINGKWGTGSERKRRLTQAGYNYTEVQSMVNKILS